jgi:F420-dependent oxidoreductase-like protein
MRFGAFVPQGWRLDLAGLPVEQHWPVMLSAARRIEDAGFESLWVYDHFHTIPVPTQEVTYEAWTMMAALAGTTEKVRLGQMCTCNTYRPPSYLAKVAASIDVISGGRLEMGIGAGWYEHEHDGYGYPFLDPGPRLRMLEEGVEIMKAMWTQDEVSYQGRHYTLKGAISQPKPLQQPHIPIWVAGGGEQVTLRIAAKHADYSNFGMELEAFVHKSEVLQGHCRDLGRDFDSITRSANFNILCADTEVGVEDKLEWLGDHMRGHVPEDRAESFTNMYRKASGTPEQVIEKLKGWQEAGMGYAIINFYDLAYDPSSLDLFASEVMPAFS